MSDVFSSEWKNIRDTLLLGGHGFKPRYLCLLWESILDSGWLLKKGGAALPCKRLLWWINNGAQSEEGINNVFIILQYDLLSFKIIQMNGVSYILI